MSHLQYMHMICCNLTGTWFIFTEVNSVFYFKKKLIHSNKIFFSYVVLLPKHLDNIKFHRHKIQIHVTRIKPKTVWRMRNTVVFNVDGSTSVIRLPYFCLVLYFNNTRWVNIANAYTWRHLTLKKTITNAAWATARLTSNLELAYKFLITDNFIFLSIFCVYNVLAMGNLGTTRNVWNDESRWLW